MHLVCVVCQVQSDCWSSEEKLSLYFYRYELQIFWNYSCFVGLSCHIAALLALLALIAL